MLKKIISKGCYVHYVVTKMDTVWSNCIFMAPGSCLTMVGCGSLDKIMLSDHGWILEQTCQEPVVPTNDQALETFSASHVPP